MTPKKLVDRLRDYACSDADVDEAADMIEQMQGQIDALVKAAVFAHSELNAIRARDGVPYDRDGMRYGVSEEYFSGVVDALDAAVRQATGHGAHCHPRLYD